MSNSRTICLNTLTHARWLSKVLVRVALRTSLMLVFCTNSWARTAVALIPAEQQLAAKLANAQVWQKQHSTGELSSHQLGIQTLSIELDERKKGEQTRRARVYQYNYQSQQARLVLIDLESAQLVKHQIIDSVHLPLNDVEISTARDLVEQQPDIMRQLNQNLTRRGMPSLTDLKAIDVKASIFEPDDDQHVCAIQRCALVSLFDQTRTVFSVEPLVNLQSLSVSTLQQSL